MPKERTDQQEREYEHVKDSAEPEANDDDAAATTEDQAANMDYEGDTPN